jgi:hypothetical protein
MTVVHPYHPFVYPPSGLVMIGNTNMHTENVILNLREYPFFRETTNKFKSQMAGWKTFLI